MSILGLIYNTTSIKDIAKVTLLLSLFSFLNTSKLSSQETHFGVKAGLNYSSIVGDLTDGIKFRFSGHGGVYVESEFTYNFSLQAELLYSSQGFQFSTDLQAIESGGGAINDNDFRTNVQLNFLTIPILGKFELKDGLGLEFGPQFGFLLNQVSIIKNLDERDNSEITENRTGTSGNFQLDYGAVVGLAIEFTDTISLEPRFYVGLRNRLNGLEGQLQNYNVAIQISLNYAIK